MRVPKQRLRKRHHHYFFEKKKQNGCESRTIFFHAAKAGSPDRLPEVT
jgi:hypothetical protein